MKSKIFKKLIAGASALAMVAQFGFVLPASAKSFSESFDFEDNNKVFTDDSRITGAIENDTTLKSNVIGFTCAGNAQNGYSFAHYDFADKVSGATQIKIELDYYNTNGGRAILSFGDAAVRGSTGGSEKATYNNIGVAFNLGSDKSNGIIMGISESLTSITNKWMHVAVTVNEIEDTLSYKITDIAGVVIKEANDVSFVSKEATAVTQIDLFGYINSSHCAMIDNISITAEISDVQLCDVTYSVNGQESKESVFKDSKPSKIPTETSKTGYIFKGWSTDGSTEYDSTKQYLTSEQVAQTIITSDIIFTAVYEPDTAYIEPMETVEFDVFPTNNLLVAGEDANTAASNVISVKITGELGTNLLTTPDERVTDFDVKYELKGFRWVASKNEATTDQIDGNGYCDSYGELVVNNEAKTADFQIKSHPFNYYGQVVATVTYNGVTKTISRPLVYIGNPAKTSSNDILPRGGYISDFNKYAPDMAGYETVDAGAVTGNIKDVTTDNWVTFGGNTRKLMLMEEDGSKFMRLEASGTKSSTFAVNTIEAVTDTQVVFDQMVRFHTANSSILLKTDAPNLWSDNATSFSVTFNDGKLVLNGNEIADAATDVWYRLVIISDVTSKKCYAEVYGSDKITKLGTSEIANFTNMGSTKPTYYMFRTPDNALGSLDFNDVKIYRATIDQASMSTTTTSTTLAIPEEGETATTAELTVSAKTTEGYDAIGIATWSVADDAEGITVTPSANDSHTATVSVASSASAGTATINVMIGGIQKSIDLTITSSQDSIAFNTPVVNSVSIPMDDKNTVVNYAARVIGKDGAAIAGKTVTFDLYDKNNTNPATVEGVTFANGVLTVTKNAKPCVVTVRATSTNSNGETITNAVKVTIHGLAFDFGAGTDEDVVSGYTPITPTTAYTAKAGYGIEGSPTVGGTASLDDADTDNLEGTFTFKANVTPNKVYKVKVNYSGRAAFENISADLSGVERINTTKGTMECSTYVHDDGVLDITFSPYKSEDGSINVPSIVSSIVIEKTDDKTIPAGGKPNVYTVGDSTIANNGSWAYVIDHNPTNYPELTALATFSNNGRGGKNLKTYYTGGELWDKVVTNVRAGDYVMIGDMGTNGMGTDFKGSFTYYVDACLARGAKVILNSYSPHMYVGAYANCYDSTTHTFNGWRQDSYDNIVREIYEERKDEFAGFVEIGKNADASFTAYAADYAKNGYDSADAAAQAIIACAGSTPGKPDHNHYSNGTIAAKLMIEGYGGTKGIVAQLVDILSAGEEPPTPIEYTVTFKNGDTVMKTVTVESGSKVAAADIPDIPAKEGFTGKWMVGDDEFTVDTVITGNTIVTLDYTKNASDDFDIIFRWAEETDGGVLITTAVTGTGEDKFNAYVAEYDADTHALIGVAQKLIVISDAERDAKIDYVRQKDNSTLKAFVWERGNMKPRLNLTGVILPSNPIDD